MNGQRLVGSIIISSLAYRHTHRPHGPTDGSSDIAIAISNSQRTHSSSTSSSSAAQAEAEAEVELEAKNSAQKCQVTINNNNKTIHEFASEKEGARVDTVKERSRK